MKGVINLLPKSYKALLRPDDLQNAEFKDRLLEFVKRASLPNANSTEKQMLPDVSLAFTEIAKLELERKKLYESTKHYGKMSLAERHPNFSIYFSIFSAIVSLCILLLVFLNHIHL